MVKSMLLVAVNNGACVPNVENIPNVNAHRQASGRS